MTEQPSTRDDEQKLPGIVDHPMPTSTGSSTTTACLSDFCYLLTIPKDLLVLLLLFLNVTELCSHCGVSKDSEYLALFALKRTKTTSFFVGRNCSLDLIKVVGNRCSGLSYLRIKRGYRGVDDNTLTVLRQALSKLPTVRVSVSRFFEGLTEILRVLAELNIQVEEIHGGNYDGWAGWSHFTATLKLLHHFGRPIDPSDIQFLQQCRNLEELAFEPKSNREIMDLGKCSKLRSLNLLGAPQFRPITLPYFPAVTELCVGANPPSLEMIASNMPNLRYLFMPCTSPFAGDEFRSLASLKHLKSLRICIFNGLEELIRSCARLEMLQLYACMFGGIDLVEAFEQVKEENVYVCAWEWLQLFNMREPRDDGRDLSVVRRKLDVVAPRLINVRYERVDVKGSGEPKVNTLCRAFRWIFSRGFAATED